MYVERWDDLYLVFWGAYSSMGKTDQVVCIAFIKWIEEQGSRYAGIDPDVIGWYIEWIKPIRDRSAGLRWTDLTNSISFMRYLNYGRPADEFHTQEGCKVFNHYWYDNACHKDVKRIVAPPLPPPKPPPPRPEPPEPIVDDPGIGDFLSMNLDLMIYYNADVGYEIARTADLYVNYWNSVLGGYQVWSDIISAQEALVDYINYPLALIEGALYTIDSWIGDITRLGGVSIVDSIRKLQDGAGDTTNKQVKELYDVLEVRWNEQWETLEYSTRGFMGSLKKIVVQWEDQGDELGGLAKTDIDEVLKGTYGLYETTIATIKARLDQIEREVGIVTEEVTIDITEPIFEEGKGFEWITPASIYWVKDELKRLADAVFDALDVIIDELSKPVNLLLHHVYDISEPWLTALKARLGDVGGEYDLAADEAFIEVKELLSELGLFVLEPPESWIKILANRLQGYFSTGIGEKGEKGDPGRPGEQGVQGIPGVQGEPGEPGEGVGMAIEDIDSQLKERLIDGAAIVTDNLTAVIDYNIRKIGEIFTRYDLEVKPITEFLTTDMQESLTGIIAAFDTPEALIAFILDVPEGQEDATYELMQLLIAQTMERGL